MDRRINTINLIELKVNKNRIKNSLGGLPKREDEGKVSLGPMWNSDDLWTAQRLIIPAHSPPLHLPGCSSRGSPGSQILLVSLFAP